MRVKLRDIAQAAATDPKQALLDKIGNDLDYVEVFHNLVLVATYIAPPLVFKGPNGELIPFERSDAALREDEFQGSVGLVLKLGPLAFEDCSVAQFGEIKIKAGDWVFFRPADGLRCNLGPAQSRDGLSCRWFEDVHIKGRVPDPSMIY